MGLIYLQIDLDFVRDHKHDDLAARLNVSFERAVVLVLSLFAGAGEHAITGDLLKVEDVAVARWAGWRSKTLPPVSFVASLIGAGWVTEDRQIVGWKSRYAKVLAKRDADRKTAPPSQPKPETCAPTRAVKRELEERTTTTTSLSAPPTPDPVQPPKVSSPLPARGGAAHLRQEQAKTLQRRWNALAHELNLPQAQTLSAARLRGATARISEGLLDRWLEFSAGLRASPWHLGANERDYRANFDWLCRPNHWLGIVERVSAPVAVAAGAGVAARPPRRERESLLDRIAAEYAEPDDPVPATNGGNPS